MKLFSEKFVKEFFEEDLLSELDNVSIKECLQYTSYGFFISAMISLFQGDIYHVITALLIGIFLKL